MAGAEVLRQKAFPGGLSDDQEELVWALAKNAAAAYVTGQFSEEFVQEVLKVLGMTSRAVGRTIQVQSGVTMALGVLIGVPLGIAGGRWAWRAYASEIDVIDVGSIPFLAVVLVAALAGLLAFVVALGPALAARRASVAGLRPE